MSNEKITKEELLEKLGGIALSDDDLEKVNGGRLIQQKDGTYYCTRCGKTVNNDHSCSGRIVIA